jgi:membrane-associated phospholipid phosphatase
LRTSKEVVVALVRIQPTEVDLRVARAVASHADRKTESFAQFLSWGADEKVLFAAAALGWLACRRAAPETRRLGDHVFAVTAIAAVLPHLMKALVDQERPDRRRFAYNGHGIPSSGRKYDAFPSGHAVHIGALASTATLLPQRWRNLAWLVGGALAATRIVVLAHWLSDVVAGLAIGTAIDRGLRHVTRPVPCRRSRPGEGA